MRSVRWQVLGMGLLLCLPGLARANGTTPTSGPPVRDKVPIKVSLSVVADSFVIPTDPPIMSVRWAGTGQSSLLGPVTGSDTRW
jgi:hypothetical protein